MTIIVINSIQGMEHYVNIAQIVSWKTSSGGGLLIALANGESLMTRDFDCPDVLLRTINNISRLDHIRRGKGWD